MRESPVIGSAGELLVEFVAAARNGRHLQPGSYTGPYPSGAPGIFIDQAGKLGARSLFAGAVGGDAFGRVILDRLDQDGVSSALIATIPAVPTGSAFVSYNDDGSRDFVFNIAHSAAARLGDPNEIAAAMLGAGVEIFHISGSSLGDSVMGAGLLTLARHLTDRGVKLSLDPNIRKELLGDPAYRRTVDTLTAMSSFFLPSDDDAEILFPGEVFDTWAPRLVAAGVEIVVLKRGDQGAHGITRQGDDIDLPAFGVTVVDPTGAGDCFCATLVTLVASGMAFADALRHANAAGALAVGRIGPMEGNSTMAEIKAFLGSRA